LESLLEQARKHVKETQPASKRLQTVGWDVRTTESKLAKTKAELVSLEALLAKTLKQQEKLVEQQKQQEAKLDRLRKEEAELQVAVGTGKTGPAGTRVRTPEDMEEELDENDDAAQAAEAEHAKVKAENEQLRAELAALKAKDKAAAGKRAAGDASEAPPAKKGGGE
jgi:chromosome segregation ATPase